MIAKRLALGWVAGALAACAGLPPTQRPVQLSTEAPLMGSESNGGVWPSPEWWKRYQDATLDQLVAMALESSPSLVTAQSRLDTARQSVRLAGAAAGARVEAEGDAGRQRLSENGLFAPRLLGFAWYNQFDLGLQASYTFDWWGKQRDAIDAAMDEAHAAQAEHAAAALMLANSVTDTYFGWQADQSRLALAREREALVVRQAKIMTLRIGAELEAADSSQRADSSLAAVREQVAALQGSADLRWIALAALVGRAPAALPTPVARPLPSVGSGLPDDVRIDLIARRADLTASRWRVEAAEKNRAGARAEFFPDISVNALAGLQSIDVGKLLEYSSRAPSVSAAIHLPIFDAGRLRARYAGAQAAIDAAVAGYQETLVNAARDVATQAASRRQLAAQREQRRLGVEAAEKLRAGAAARVRQGVTDSRDELTASEALIEQRDALVQLDAAALSADIGLQRALGGGYATQSN
jgi:multidrug efflux system outer membrane protein